MFLLVAILTQQVNLVVIEDFTLHLKVIKNDDKSQEYCTLLYIMVITCMTMSLISLEATICFFKLYDSQSKHVLVDPMVES